MNNIELKAIASAFYECYNRRDLEESFENFIDADLINHTMDGTLDRSEWLSFDKAFLAACPNLQLTIKEQFVEDNRVVTHWSCCGTHTGDFFGMEGTGNLIKLTGISIDCIRNGKITEHFAMADFTQFMTQFSNSKVEHSR
jgi:predicted ester cyclase